MPSQPSAKSKPRRSPAQIQASRSNGAKSNGPVTPEGKQRSSQNSRTHGLRSSSVGIEEENKALHERMRKRYYDEHRPEGPTECTLVDQIVFCAYQLYRAGAIEIDEPMDFTTGLGSSGMSERIARYRTGYTRIMYKGMDQLRKVQTERCARHAPYRRYAGLPIMVSSGAVLNRQRDYLRDHRVFGTSVHPETDPFEDSPVAPWRPDEPKPEPKPHPNSGLNARVRPQLAVQSHPVPESVLNPAAKPEAAPTPPSAPDLPSGSHDKTVLNAHVGRSFPVQAAVDPAPEPAPAPAAQAAPLPGALPAEVCTPIDCDLDPPRACALPAVNEPPTEPLAANSTESLPQLGELNRGELQPPPPAPPLTPDPPRNTV